MKVALAFLSEAAPLDYGRRLLRLRWRRAIGADGSIEVEGGDSAAATLSRAESWVLVRDDSAVPVAAPHFPVPSPGRVLLAGTRFQTRPSGSSPHTLRELERALRVPNTQGEDAARAPAIAFRASDFPPASGETVADFVTRLLATPAAHERDRGLFALPLEDSSEKERPELSHHIPAAARRLLDVGCGAAGTGAAAKGRRQGLSVTGIEKDPAAAKRARARLDRVVEADAGRALELLALEEEKYDAFLFADVLEHLEDPVSALAKARALATPGATLVVSVPNVGHISLVRDLLLGRFDPLPAGLADAGHLRWFTKSSLADALEEAGWRVVSVESAAGAPAPEAQEFLSRLSAWPELDRESLATYQWIAVARPAPPIW